MPSGQMPTGGQPLGAYSLAALELEVDLREWDATKPLCRAVTAVPAT
jgi:hypothetical protein